MTEEKDEAVFYEDLAGLEEDFDDVDMQIMRTQYSLQKPLYMKRKATVAKIPNFWPLVLEQAPPEMDQYIQPEDSRVFAESLENIEVTRPELDADNEHGDPRSLRIAFNFRSNDRFEDTRLVKDFWWRRRSDGWSGLVSEPVRINWKSGKDLSQGLSDLAYKLFQARKKTGDMTNRGLPEYTKLKHEIESWNARNTSFFTWFSWVSDRRYVTAEESEKANKRFAERKEKRRNGGKAEENEDQDDEAEDLDDDLVEAMDDGEALAVCIAEELWPSAIKYFTEAQETDELSDEDLDDDDDDEIDMEAVDIQGIVQGGNEGPPTKKQKM